MHVAEEDIQSYLVAETINYVFLHKFHKGSGHKSESNMMHTLSQADVVKPHIRKVVNKVTTSCK